jgi:hypothetical protein
MVDANKPINGFSLQDSELDPLLSKCNLQTLLVV